MKLDLTNWDDGWRDECEATLGLQAPHNLDWTIDPSGVPPAYDALAAIQRKKALNISKVNTSEQMMAYIKPGDGPLEAWTTFKSMFAGSQGARQLQLKSAFNKTAMKREENMAMYTTRVLRLPGDHPGRRQSD
jgi:hypothetical protein